MSSHSKGKIALGNEWQELRRERGITTKKNYLDKRKKITVDDLLNKDSLNDAINKLLKARNKIEDLVIIWVDDKEIRMVTSVPTRDPIHILERAKKILLEDEEKD